MANIITDFSSTEGDVIGLANTSLDFNTLEFVTDGSDTIIRAFGVDLAVLADIQPTQIDRSDLVFV